MHWFSGSVTEASHVWVRFLAGEPYLYDRMLYHALYVYLLTSADQKPPAQPEKGQLTVKHFTTQAEKLFA